MIKAAYIFLFFCIIFTGCINIERPVNKSKLADTDYRLFQGTEVWPLARAAYYNDFDEVKCLLKDNPELANIKDSIIGGTILRIAIARQDYDLFKILLDYGADVNYHDKLNDASPLMEACSQPKGNLRFARDLIDYGALVNDTSTVIGTPIMTAATHSTLPFVKLLLETGADPNYRTEGGDNVLWYALAADHYDIALYLMENGADYKQPTSISESPDGEQLSPLYIDEQLRFRIPEMGTDDYKEKQRIIKFLNNNGFDYFNTPIPDFMIKRIKERYPDIWQDYIKNY